MKKALVLAVTALILSFGANVASATPIIRTLCSLPYHKFMQHGLTPFSPQFSPNGKNDREVLYAGEKVKDFFKVINVEPEDLSHLKADQNYSVRYDCYVLRGLGHASLYIEQKNLVPNQTPDTVTVNWEFTK